MNVFGGNAIRGIGFTTIKNFRPKFFEEIMEIYGKKHDFLRVFHDRNIFS